MPNAISLVPSLTLLASLALTLACDPLAPFVPVPVDEPTGTDCGEAPASFDPSSDIVQAAGSEGCVRIERQIDEEGVVAPQRLVIHAEGFTRRYDIDTTELTYEGAGGDGDVITTTTDDDVAVRLQVDVCTGEWTVSVDEGEVLLPVVGQ